MKPEILTTMDRRTAGSTWDPGGHDQADSPESGEERLALLELEMLSREEADEASFRKELWRLLVGYALIFCGVVIMIILLVVTFVDQAPVTGG